MKKRNHIVRPKKRRGWILLVILLFLSTIVIALRNDLIFQKIPNKWVASLQSQQNSSPSNQNSQDKDEGGSPDQQNQQDASYQLKQQHTDWKLILVNQHHPLSEKYKVTLETLSNGEKVDQKIYPDLQKMFNAARSAGVYPQVNSGYRSREEQTKVLNKEIEKYVKQGYSKKEAKKMAKQWVAEPGTSEHQLGMAVDINADKSKSTNEAVYAWLENNAHRYGFVLRYPATKTAITGINYEPWHFRFVGMTAATEMFQKNLCLEEYLQTLQMK